MSRGKKRSWAKLPFIGKMQPNPCMNCPDPRAQLRPDRAIAVGFGDAHLSKDGQVIWGENEEGRDLDFDEMMTCGQAEVMAVADPDHDWRIVLHGPMHGETYQRHGKGRWVCVEQNVGFA